MLNQERPIPPEVLAEIMRAMSERLTGRLAFDFNEGVPLKYEVSRNGRIKVSETPIIDKGGRTA